MKYPIYQKVAALLKQHFSKEEIVEFYSTYDGDGGDQFHDVIGELCEEVAPEEFTDPSDD